MVIPQGSGVHTCGCLKTDRQLAGHKHLLPYDEKYMNPKLALKTSSAGRSLYRSPISGGTQRVVWNVDSPTWGQGRRTQGGGSLAGPAPLTPLWGRGRGDVGGGVGGGLHTFQPGTSFMMMASSSRFSRSICRTLGKDREGWGEHPGGPTAPPWPSLSFFSFPMLGMEPRA